MKTPKLLICLMLSLGTLALPGLAEAQGFKWWQSDRFKRDLALSAEQVTQLDTIFSATQPTMRTQKAALEKVEAKLARAMVEARADELQIVPLIERVESTRAELAKTRSLMFYKMRRVLSEEQSAKIEALHKQWERDRRGRPPQEHQKNHPPDMLR